MKFINLIYLFVIFFFACGQYSTNINKDSKLDATCIPIIDSFFNKIQANNYKSAVDGLLLMNENIDPKDSSTIQLKARFSEINQYSGKFIGTSLIKKRSINDDISVYSYLAKYDKKFYRFIFIFYNNGINTKIYSFKFDDNVDAEIEESLKLYQ
jgi:hypothetical protein